VLCFTNRRSSVRIPPVNKVFWTSVICNLICIANLRIRSKVTLIRSAFNNIKKQALNRMLLPGLRDPGIIRSPVSGSL
jgi:hypothetical protein